MNYIPAGKSIVPTKLIKFKLTINLSQSYDILIKAAERVGKVYEESGGEALIQLAKNYYKTQEEFKYLSKLVKKHLREYDRKILNSLANNNGRLARMSSMSSRLSISTLALIKEHP